MNDLPPILRDQRTIDKNHLKLLAIFHFIGAGLGLIGTLFIFVHYMMFNTFFSNPEMWNNQNQSLPPVEFFGMFKWFYIVFAVWFIGSGSLNLLSGLCINARKCRALSMVVAGINCFHIPLGTVLGVFTLIILLRDSVRELYES